MLRNIVLLCLVAWGTSVPALAAAPMFPSLGSAQSIRGELVSADFIHRTGQFRSADGELKNFSLPPYACVTYRGTDSDLRDVPLGTKLEFLLLPDADGRPTHLVGTKHDEGFDAAQQRKFIKFTTARGLAGWVDRTSGKRVTVTFFGNAEQFDVSWGDAFAVGKDITLCAANDELRTWQPTSCGERGKVVENQTVPVEGYGSSGRRVVIEVGHMLEGFRQGRVVRVFGAGWKVQNQFFQECLINYGYSHRGTPDFRENMAQHYPEHFPYRTEYGNRHRPWFQAAEGSPLPMYSEHLMLGDLTVFDTATQAGEFKTEGTGESVKFTLIETGSRMSMIRFQSDSTEAGRGKRLPELPLGQRYRFHMYQDAAGVFNRCSFISDDYSHATLNNLTYQIQRLDLKRGICEVTWQGVPVQNYQKDMETPPPYGHSLVRLVPETRVWKNKTADSVTNLKVGEHVKFNAVAEYPGQPSHCTDVWVIENPGSRTKR